MESWLLPARDGPSAPPPGPGGTRRSGLVRGQRLDSVVLEVLLQAQGSWEAVGHWDAPGAGTFWGQAGQERRRGIFFFVAGDFLKKIFVKQTRTPLNIKTPKGNDGLAGMQKSIHPSRGLKQRQLNQDAVKTGDKLPDLFICCPSNSIKKLFKPFQSKSIQSKLFKSFHRLKEQRSRPERPKCLNHCWVTFFHPLASENTPGKEENRVARRNPKGRRFFQIAGRESQPQQRVRGPGHPHLSPRHPELAGKATEPPFF